MQSTVNIGYIYKLLFGYLLLLLFINNNIYGSNKKQYIILSSGQEGGAYHSAGKFITETLNKHLSGYQVINIISEGSYQNFERLDSRSCDIIIAQRNIVIEKYYTKDNPIRNLEILLPLFSESYQIIVNQPKGVLSFQEFQDLLSTKKIKNIGIGKNGTASNITTREIFNILGLRVSEDRFIEESTQIQYDAFRNGQLDAVVYFAAVPVKKLMNNNNSVVSFNADEIKKLTSYFKDFNVSNFDIGLYNNNNK